MNWALMAPPGGPDARSQIAASMGLLAANRSSRPRRFSVGSVNQPACIGGVAPTTSTTSLDASSPKLTLVGDTSDAASVRELELEANRAVAEARFELGVQQGELAAQKRTVRALEGDAFRVRDRLVAVENEAARQAEESDQSLARLSFELRESESRREKDARAALDTQRALYEKVEASEARVARLEAQLEVAHEEGVLAAEAQLAIEVEGREWRARHDAERARAEEAIAKVLELQQALDQAGEKGQRQEKEAVTAQQELSDALERCGEELEHAEANREAEKPEP